LSEIINDTDDLEVVGTANDPIFARDKIKKLNPDVITLDVEMPRMDGISFLKNLMRLRPMPVVMISTLTEKGAKVTMDALSYGAVDYVAKPSVESGHGIEFCRDEILEKIRTAAAANVGALERTNVKESENAQRKSSTVESDTNKSAVDNIRYMPKEGHILTIGASTGGTEAIKEVLLGLPANCPATVLTQHIPATFSTSYAQRMNLLCKMTVHEASDGQKIEPGNVYIAPGDDHLTIKKKGSQFYCVLSKSDPVNRHRPSVDVLFKSVATEVGKNATGVLLTGMGADGAKELLTLKELGCHTIIQDQASSVVWGMPGAAFNLNAHCSMLPLHKIASKLLSETGRIGKR
jgi:two-component system chemotaxis response regulator CheB